MKKRICVPYGIFRFVIPSIIAATISCDMYSASIPPVSIDPPEGLFEQSKADYFKRNDSIIILMHQCECLYDTVTKESIQKVPYRYSLSEPTLSLFSPVKNDSGRSIGAITVRYVRLSGDDDLNGRWLFDSLLYDLSSDSASAKDSQTVVKAYTNTQKSLRIVWIEIVENSITVHSRPGDPATPGSTLLKEWRDAIAKAKVAIAIDSAGPLHILLRGLKTNDSVMVVDSLFSGKRIFRSTNPIDKPNPYYFDGVCPKKQFPPWLLERFVKKNKAD